MTANQRAGAVAGRPADPQGWRQERQDLLRGVAGGAIVGMPLLYTMEMWEHGLVLTEWHLLGLLAAILLINFLFSFVVGLREESTLFGAFADAVTAIGIGILFSTLVLWLIGEVTPDTALPAVAGKILIESAGVSLGVSFANAYRGKSRTGDDAQEQDQGSSGGGSEPKKGSDDQPEDRERRQLHADVNDLGATLAGATVFALNIAPTEEVLLIATRLAPWQQLALLAAAVALCYVILFASEFEEPQVHVESVFQHPWAETAMACAVSLGVSYLLLALVGQREALSHPATTVAAVITLGLPAIVGGAAGRLVV
jgi:putative integral membrane protein (TIGR02587 family)